MHIQLNKPFPQMLPQETPAIADLQPTQKERSQVPLHIHTAHIPHLIQLLHEVYCFDG